MSMNAELDALWLSLRSDPRRLTLDALLPLLVHADGRRADLGVDACLDSYAFFTRIDAVDEELTPFVPFVKAMTQREFDLVSYGQLLHPDHKTVVVAHDFDSPLGDVAAREGIVEAARGETSADKKEYNIFLLRLVTIKVSNPDADGAEMDSIALIPHFRLLFRNLSKDGQAKYCLSGVFVSGHHFNEVHDDCRRLQALAPDGAALAYPRLRPDNCEALRQRQEVWRAWQVFSAGSTLSNALAKLESGERTLDVAKLRAKPKPGSFGKKVEVCGYDIEGASSDDELDARVAADVPAASSVTSGEDFLPRECRYTTDRMGHRMLVVERVPGAGRAQWEAFCDELGLNGSGLGSPAEAVRIVFKDTRDGRNAIVEDELLAYLPADAEANACVAYGTPAEEQLRLWVQNALVTAEVAGIHQVLVKLDIPLILSRCCGLLSAPSVTASADAVGRRAAAAERATVVLLETVEAFVRTSGTVWRAIVMCDPPLTGCDDEPEAAMAQRVLRAIQMARVDAETGNPIAPGPNKGYTVVKHKKQMAIDEIPTASPSRREPHRRVVDNEPPQMLTVPNDVRRMENVIRSAAVSAVPVTDEQLRKLFHHLDRKKDGVLDMQELKRVFLKNTDIYDGVTLTERGTIAKKAGQDTYLTTGCLLSPLDACGLPLDDESIERFLKKFCRTLGNKMTYPEFCVMMLEIARR